MYMSFALKIAFSNFSLTDEDVFEQSVAIAFSYFA